MKRACDLLFTLLLLPIILPLIGIVAFLVRIKLGTPVFFIQNRPGLKGNIFQMFKFRSMTSERDVDGNLQLDPMRLTPFGKWLRSTSLDELPEILNVLKGDMSLIVPRPLLVEYLPLYSPDKHADMMSLLA